MDRAETVRLLAEVFQTEGYSDRWRTLMDSIREHGPLHVEWLICLDCGGEFERAYAQGALPLRCDACRIAKRRAEQQARDRRRTV